MQDIERVDSLAGWYTLEGAAQALGVSKKAVRYRVMRYRATVVRMGKNDLVNLDELRRVGDLMRSRAGGENPSA
jgi:hypothetical protein